jgi:hypothetical protein
VINIFILTYYVHLVGVQEVIDCRNARSGKLQDNRVLGGIYEPKKDEIEENEDNCMRRSFLIRTPKQILLERSNHEG